MRLDRKVAAWTGRIYRFGLHKGQCVLHNTPCLLETTLEPRVPPRRLMRILDPRRKSGPREKRRKMRDWRGRDARNAQSAHAQIPGSDAGRQADRFRPQG